MIQTPQDLLVYALQEIQDAEAQASQATLLAKSVNGLGADQS